jgi:chorismate mutase
MQLSKMSTWAEGVNKPLIIAGPCSVETEEQLLETSTALKNNGISIIRGGIWKPRTRPNSFEGIGVDGLKWIQNVKKELGGIKFATEVATPQHVEEALKHDIDILWIGARSTVNPFTVQEIADALKGTDIPVLVKNPINPELALWIGALERIHGAGITKIGAIHRGFSSFAKSRFRNIPQWQIALDLKTALPEIPMICDPSHITGNRDMIQEISQKALDLNYDGLIIESHRDPDNAWSDAAQQVTPARLKEIVDALTPRKDTSENSDYLTHLEELRMHIDHADREILEAIANRMSFVEKLGWYKKENNVAVFQVGRWDEVFKSRPDWAEKLKLRKDFISELYKLLHDESIWKQTEIMNTPAQPVKS